MIQINGFKVLGLICMLILAALGLIPFSSKDILTLISYALLAVIIIFAGWFLICRESPESGKNWLLTLPITVLACCLLYTSKCCALSPTDRLIYA